jgi:hypothetical protein
MHASLCFPTSAPPNGTILERYNCLRYVGTLRLATGPGHLPAVLLAAQAVVNAASQHSSASWALASIASQAALAQYGPSVHDLDMFLDHAAVEALGLLKVSEKSDSDADLRVSACDAVSAALKHTASAVRNLSFDNYFGLLPQQKGSDSFWKHPSLPDAHLNLLVCASCCSF